MFSWTIYSMTVRRELSCHWIEVFTDEKIVLKIQVKSVIYQKVMDLRRRLSGWCWTEAFRVESWLRAWRVFRLGAEGLRGWIERRLRTETLLLGLWAKRLLLGHWAERLLLLDRTIILDRWRGRLSRRLWTLAVWHWSFKLVLKQKAIVNYCLKVFCGGELKAGATGWGSKAGCAGVNVGFA